MSFLLLLALTKNQERPGLPTESTRVGRAFIHAVCPKPSHPLVSVCQLVPDRSKADEDQRAENRKPLHYAEGVDRRGRNGPHNPPPIRDERGAPSQHQIGGQEKVGL